MADKLPQQSIFWAEWKAQIRFIKDMGGWGGISGQIWVAWREMLFTPFPSISLGQYNPRIHHLCSYVNAVLIRAREKETQDTTNSHQLSESLDIASSARLEFLPGSSQLSFFFLPYSFVFVSILLLTSTCEDFSLTGQCIIWCYRPVTRTVVKM